MNRRTTTFDFHFPYEAQHDSVIANLAPSIALLGRRGCEVIQFAGLGEQEHHPMQAAIAERWPDVMHDTMGESCLRGLRLYTRSACKTVLLHHSSPLAALPEVLQQTIIAQALAPLPVPLPMLPFAPSPPLHRLRPRKVRLSAGLLV
jgi:hypothetical protein